MMNAWSLVKHDNIKLLLISLQMQGSLENIRIADEKDSNYFSIVLIKQDQPEVRAYIYTYKGIRELYGVHLEYPRHNENAYNTSMMIYDELSLQQIRSTLETHFDVCGL